ncbi:MAG: hypothetical protein HFE76_12285 [Firmicutes bacterium]|nr:hypothetical protein [Bacillota bacterium]
MDIKPEKKHNAIDLLITMVVDELSKELNADPDEICLDFLSSSTGKLLYDEESKLWWCGPSYIAELYKECH